MHKKNLLLIFAVFADLIAYLFCLSAKWQRQLGSDSLAQSSLSRLFSFSEFPLWQCLTGNALPITEREYPRGHHPQMLTKRIVPSLLQDVIYFLRFCPKNLLQHSIPSPTTTDLTLSGLAEEGFDPARSRARDPQGQQIGSKTPAALVPEYWQVRLATVLPSELCPTSFLPLSLFLCSFSHGKSSSAPFSWVGNFFF